MIRSMVIILALFLAVPEALADDISLTYSQAASLYRGLQALNTYSDIAADGGQKKLVQLPFDFTTNTRIAIARDLAAIEVKIKPVEQALIAVAKDIKDDPKYKTDNERAIATATAISDSDKSPLQISLVELTEADLKLDINKAITPTILVQIAPVIKDFASDTAKH